VPAGGAAIAMPPPATVEMFTDRTDATGHTGAGSGEPLGSASSDAGTANGRAGTDA
jgi:hypothetical protein